MRLIDDFEFTNPNTLEDLLLIFAKNIENSLIQAGAIAKDRKESSRNPENETLGTDRVPDMQATDLSGWVQRPWSFFQVTGTYFSGKFRSGCHGS